MTHAPKKRFGQHFLRDPSVLRQIIELGEIEEGENVLEIGAGDGTLTRALLEAGARVSAIELDRDLIGDLKALAEEEPRLNLIEGDATKSADFDFPTPTKVISNLPYQIATLILSDMCERPDWFPCMVVMVQREVGQRLAASPGGKDYGTLTLWVGHRYAVEVKRIVPPGAFHPPPKVDSALVVLQARERPLVEVPDEAGYFGLIRAAFAMRRKTLLNNLRAYVPPGAGPPGGKKVNWAEVLERAGVDGRLRAETLGAGEFARIFECLRAFQD
jgi:16S rRNA (adenine1518-N6/adenine1519-N6)-dimethyltransferase